MSEDTGPAGPAHPSLPGPHPGSPSPPPARTDSGGGSERWKEKGVRLRVTFYIAGTHVLAGFLWLLFYVGSHANK
jgi:Family of unknown function (DUF6126)